MAGSTRGLGFARFFYYFDGQIQKELVHRISQTVRVYMENRDFIVVGLQPWDIDIGSNCKNIALEISKKNRVLYVNRALDRFNLISNKKDKRNVRRLESIRGTRPDLEKVNENLWVFDPKVILESVNRLPGFLFDFFNRRNNRILAKEISNACHQLKFKHPILFIDNDFFRGLHLPDMLEISGAVYYIRDFLTKQPYFRKHGPRSEHLLMQKCLTVVANSSYLANYARDHNPESFDIGQGCDFTLFDINIERQRPHDLPVGKPIIGYVGAIVSYRLDESLLYECAAASPHLNWVFIGPEDEKFEQSALHKLENTHFLGSRPAELLPDYINSFDICINPQLVNENTLGNYPRKVDEYLALGKPVIATTTDFMHSFSPYVNLCSGSADYLSAIERELAIKDNGELKLKRREFALTHTWENSVKKMYKVLSAS